MSDDEERKRLVRGGRELEGRGMIDEAVREYVKARAPAEAGRLLSALGRLEEAAAAILAALDVAPEDAGTLADESDREMAKQASVLFARVGQEERAKQILDSLAAAPAKAAPSAPSPSAPSPSAPSPIATPPASRPPATASSSFRRPVQPVTPSFRPPAAASGSFRPPSRAPAAEESLRSRPAAKAPERAETPVVRTPPPEKPATETTRTPVPERPQAAPAESKRPTPRERRAPTSRPPPSDSKPPEQRLSASGEKVTDYSSSRESGWRDADSASIDETIEQNLAAGRKGAAARIAWDAGRFEQALEWFKDIGLHYQAGACLRSLGRHREALEELLLTPSDGAHYRKACMEIVPAAHALETLEFDVDRYLARFIDEGPKQSDEIPVFVQLAQLYRARDFAQGARRCCVKILALDPQNTEAIAMRAELDQRAQPALHDPNVAPGELPPLPTLEEFVGLARANAPARPD